MKSETNCQETIDKETEVYYYILNREETVKVCYENYFDYIEQEKKKEEWMLHEESETYEPQKEEFISYKHDKTYKEILSNKEDVACIINRVLELDEESGIQPKEIEKYKSSFITKQFKNREADIVYKMKEKDIFFLIEHQSSIDYSMPYRIEEYRMEIIRSAIDLKKVRTKNYKMPEVIPIVIYTGEEGWKVRIYLRKIEDGRFSKLDLLKYNVIDVNEYTEEELLESNHLIDKVFLMERTKSGEEFVQVLEKIIANTSKEERKKICEIVKWLLREKLTEEKVQEIIEKVEGEDEGMLAVVEMLRKENEMLREEGRKEGRKQGRREGKKEGKMEIVSVMKKKGIEIKMIREITGFSEEEINEIS